MGPQSLENYIGQDTIRYNLEILIIAARKRGEALDHLIFYGPSGVGKMTMALAVANEMGVNIKDTSGPAIERAGALAAILTNLHMGDVLLIQQIEAIRKPVIEVLVPAAVDFAFDIIIGKGPSARPIRLKLPRFTIIGTTFKISQVDERLIGSMLLYEFGLYNVLEISKILLSLAKQQGINLDVDMANLMAEYCNGSSSKAFTLLGRINKYAIAYGAGRITQSIIKAAIAVFGHENKPHSKGRQSIPDNVKMFVWQRDQGRCVICGSQENLEFDHIIPVSKGGSNTARNIQLLCENHNRAKGGNLV